MNHPLPNGTKVRVLNDACEHCNLDSDFENVINTQIIGHFESFGELRYTILSGEKILAENILEVLDE